MTAAPLVQIDNLSRTYPSGDKKLVVFEHLSAAFRESEQVAVVGESGAGKSTLLHLIAGLDTPTSGTIYYKGTDITGLSESALSLFRNREIGYVWQQHHLLPEFTAKENVMMPLLVRGLSPGTAAQQAQERLEEVGLEDRASHRAGELSGGEQQRIALARALAGEPSLLLADEPTGNLDEKTAEVVFALLSEVRRRRGMTCVLVTHNREFASRCDRVLKLEGGILREMEQDT